MTQAGFMEPRKLSPTGLAVVVTMHAAALGALALMKGPEIIKRMSPIELIDIRQPPVPPPEPPPEPVRQDPRPAQRPTFIDDVRPVIDLPTYIEPVTVGQSDPVIIRDPPGPVIVEPRVEPTPPPVRVAAEFDPRYAGDQQPPYPPAEERAGREGTVRLRVTVGADGRVKSVQRLNASSDAFWRATERHALARWRFRPATVDGRPIESTKLLTINFRLQG